MDKIVERFRRVIRQAQRVFHLAIALVFLFLAVSGVVVALELWQEHRHKGNGGVAEIAIVAGFAALLMIFALYSFAKARSVR